jgi:hypothetical protein
MTPYYIILEVGGLGYFEEIINLLLAYNKQFIKEQAVVMPEHTSKLRNNARR